MLMEAARMKTWEVKNLLFLLNIGNSMSEK